MSSNEIIQYTLTGICILGAIVWAAVRLIRTGKRKGGGCYGCPLTDSCASAGKGVKGKKECAPGAKINADCCRDTGKPR